ncbi:unnamed protein product, partial [Brugia timori]|uniref:Uncharacterized protein n=1 Tax=Brugia timori TaxID=42155 RepID=A0A0R3QEB5_9BILA
MLCILTACFVVREYLKKIDRKLENYLELTMELMNTRTDSEEFNLSITGNPEIWEGSEATAVAYLYFLTAPPYDYESLSRPSLQETDRSCNSPNDYILVALSCFTFSEVMLESEQQQQLTDGRSLGSCQQTNAVTSQQQQLTFLVTTQQPLPSVGHVIGQPQSVQNQNCYISTGQVTSALNCVSSPVPSRTT